MRTLTKSLPFLLFLLPVTGCGGVEKHDDAADGDADADSDTDADTDGDSDGDSDGDADGDSDGDSDGDADGDGDGDADGDGDGDGPCDVISCDDTRSCTTDACQVVNGVAECTHEATAGSCGRGSVCCVPSDLSCDPVDGTGCVCDSDGVGCGTCGDFDHDGEVNYGDWEVTCTGADLPTLVTCCDFYEYDVDHDGDFDDTDCETFWSRVLDPDIDDVCNPPGN